MRLLPAWVFERRALRATVLAAAVVACGQALAAEATPASAPMPALSASECAVWMRELSFARSVAEHDAAAFADHVDEQAAFAASRPEPQRGRAFITQQWADIISGKTLRLEWYPTRVTIAGRDDIAWSSGPSLFQDTAPDARQRYFIGGFHSVWKRGADGIWRVLFDDGIRSMPATEQQVAEFRAGRRDCTSLTTS